MSDYTPTTSWLRIMVGYAATTATDRAKPVEAARAEGHERFDRWLAAHDATLTEKVRRESLEEAATVCERIQNDPEFIKPGQGVAAAKIVLRGMSTTDTKGTP